MATARNQAQIIDKIEQELQDTANAFWSVAELQQYLKDALVETAFYVPYLANETLTVTSGSKNLDISGIEDLLGIIRLEYRVDKTDREFRNWEWIDDKTIRMTIDFSPDGDTARLYCEKAHHLDPDWTAATAYALGDYVAPTTKNDRRYKCTVAGTSAAVTQPTWPTTAGATVTDNTVTWTCKAELPNTLETPTNHIEDLFIDLVVAKALINKGSKHVNVVNVGSKQALMEYLQLGNARLATVLLELRKRRKPKITRLYPIG